MHEVRNDVDCRNVFPESLARASTTLSAAGNTTMSFSSTLSKSGSTGTLAQTGYGTKTGIAMQNGKWITDVGVFDVVGGVGNWRRAHPKT